jgi:hypothetical protein
VLLSHIVLPVVSIHPDPLAGPTPASVTYETHRAQVLRSAARLGQEVPKRALRSSHFNVRFRSVVTTPTGFVRMAANSTGGGGWEVTI